MKRGLIAWDKSELPPEAFQSRLAELRGKLAERHLPAALIYSDVWQSNWGRYYANFMPYWNRALIAVPISDKPVLLCSLSPRVYPWIKSVTIFDEIRPSPNLPQRVFEMCEASGWDSMGTVGALPFELDSALRSKIRLEDVDPSAGPDSWALAVYRRAAQMARNGLDDALKAAPRLGDYECVARLERGFRRAGAEDLVILLTNGKTPPAPARGEMLGPSVSIAVALEYRGHWVQLVRNAERLTQPVSHAIRVPMFGQVWAERIEIQRNGTRLFHGDTFCGTERL